MLIKIILKNISILNIKCVIISFKYFWFIFNINLYKRGGGIYLYVLLYVWI